MGGVGGVGGVGGGGGVEEEWSVRAVQQPATYDGAVARDPWRVHAWHLRGEQLEEGGAVLETIVHQRAQAAVDVR